MPRGNVARVSAVATREPQMNRLCLLAISAALILGLPPQALGEEIDDELEPGKWTFFDYDEERGWAIANDKGDRLAISSCELSKRKLRFEFTGVFENILNKKDGYYWLEAGFDDEMDGVFVYTSMEYFEYIFSFSVNRPSVSTRYDGKVLNICSRRMGADSAQECRVFPSNNFSQVVEDLC